MNRVDQVTINGGKLRRPAAAGSARDEKSRKHIKKAHWIPDSVLLVDVISKWIAVMTEPETAHEFERPKNE